MSTNDTVLLMANLAAGNPAIDLGRNFSVFADAVREACLTLGKMIIRDGEGSTKCVTIKVKGARSASAAKKIALAVANSNLVKTALFAESHNVRGRIVQSVGAAGEDVKEKDLTIRFSPLQNSEIDLFIGAGDGKGEATVYTSDLSYEYIKINAEYN